MCLLDMLDWYAVAGNPHITWAFIRMHLEQFILWGKRYGLEYEVLGALSCHPSVTLDIIATNPAFPWNWDGVSENPHLTLEFVRTHPDRPWNLYKLVLHPCMLEEMLATWNFIGDTIVLFGVFPLSRGWIDQSPVPIWDWRHLTYLATPEQIQRYPTYPWYSPINY